MRCRRGDSHASRMNSYISTVPQPYTSFVLRLAIMSSTIASRSYLGDQPHSFLATELSREFGHESAMD